MQSVIQFIQGHETVLASVAVAILDLLFALNEKANSNGILHMVYLKLKSLGQPK